MKLLMVMRSGPSPSRSSSLLDRHHAAGHGGYRNGRRAVVPTETFF
jgi:hypothetical protein